MREKEKVGESRPEVGAINVRLPCALGVKNVLVNQRVATKKCIQKTHNQTPKHVAHLLPAAACLAS